MGSGLRTSLSGSRRDQFSPFAPSRERASLRIRGVVGRRPGRSLGFALSRDERGGRSWRARAPPQVRGAGPFVARRKLTKGVGSPAVAAWRRKLDDNTVKLKSLPISDERNAVVAKDFDLRSEKVARDLAGKGTCGVVATDWSTPIREHRARLRPHEFCRRTRGTRDDVPERFGGQFVRIDGHDRRESCETLPVRV